MRLRRLLIQEYGCFERADLTLSAEPGCIDLVVAPNGAGKSVLRHAFHDLLFDIPMQSPMQFRFPYKGMRLHAEAVAADGVGFEFGWTRGAKPQRVTNDPGRYAALRAETTPDQLEQLFALDTARLRKGGLDLKGGATLAAALLSGTGELASARKVQAGIDARRVANWGPRQSKPPLNAAMAAVTKARDAARAAAQRPQERERQEQDLQAARQEHADARKAAGQTQVTLQRLNRIALTRPHLEALAVAGDWFAAHPDAPALPPGLDVRLAEARAEVARTHAVLESAEAAVKRGEAQLEGFPQDKTLDPHAHLFSGLLERLGEVEKDAVDLVAVRAELSAALDQVAASLRDIGMPPDETDAASLVPTVDLLAASRAAIGSYPGLAATSKLCGDRVAEETRRLGDAEAVPLPEGSATDGLAELLKEIRAERNPVQHATSVAGEVRAARAALEGALAKVPGWTGGVAALMALPTPVEAAFERLDAARAEAAARAGTDAGELARLEAAMATIGARLSAIGARPLPDDAAIAAARARRDGGWRLVERRVFAGAPDVAGEAAYAGGLPLAIAFERDLRAADDIADLRVRELERVDQAERLVRESRDTRARIGTAEAAACASRHAAALAVDGWAAAVAPLRLAGASTLREVRAFASARLLAVDAQEAFSLASGKASALDAQHAGWAARLSSSLAVPAGALPDLLAAADARVKAAEASRQARALHAAETKAAKAALAKAEAARQAADGTMRAWREGWDALLVRLGRPAGEAPEATAAVLDRLVDLARDTREAVTLERRIVGMEADVGRFEADVEALALALRHPRAATPFETARTLNARWTLAARQASARAETEKAVSGSRAVHDAAGQKAIEARRDLAAAIAATGARDEDGAASRLAAAREYDRHAALRDAANKGLSDHGADLPLAVLQDDARTVSAEDVAAGRDGAEEEARLALERAERAAVRLQETERAFDEAAASMQSLDAAAEHAAAAATFARLLDEQLLLRVASAMLKRAMQHVEQDAGDKGLQRISDAFGTLTGGAYELALDDADGSTLHAIERAYPNEKKRLEQLSEGTRDQLYLALRMVALREHAEAAAPLPFIADDILQTFDDRRAAAALTALVDLSRTLQVIVLTHHEHLAGLAASLAPDQIRIHRLQQ